MMRKLILECHYSLGDIVLLTGAVRDFHRGLSDRFQMDVRTGFPALWENNPYLTRLNPYDPETTVVTCDIPLVDHSNEVPSHCLHGFIDFLNHYWGTSVQPTECRGDIHISRHEQMSPSPLENIAGGKIPFWLLSAGGKYDNTIKWWDHRRYQAVVDHFRGRIQFVQVGHETDHHPKLSGVIDLRGKTSLRELVRLVYHAQGVLCGVTGLMHLAAAVPVPPGRISNRPCVVIAGGRESPHWEAYPGHQFIHTVGALSCCAAGGCWRARTLPLGDGRAEDKPENLCADVRGNLPRCMDLISAEAVIGRIEIYFQGGVASYLNSREAITAERGVSVTAAHYLDDGVLTFYTAPAAAEHFVQSLPLYPGGFKGRGLVICGGGVKMFTNAWVCINMLRRSGCKLPIQLWFLGRMELDNIMRTLVAPLDVECVDALALRDQYPVRQLNGWSLKPHAILHSPFEEVMLLDADNVPLADPTHLFDSAQFCQTGAIFWPDAEPLPPESSAWRVFNVPYRDEPSFESGQMVLNKRICWAPLNLCMWYNEHGDFFYRHVHGDKDTFHLAFRKLGQPYAMPPIPMRLLPATMCQHDFNGRRLFQHRNRDKWNLFGTNRHIRGFEGERLCFTYLEELRQKWISGKSHSWASQSEQIPRKNRRHRSPSRVRIATCMISCRARERLRQQTLARLARTDWGLAPLSVVVDEERFSQSVDNLTHTAWKALQHGLATDAHYILYLGDDLDFNRHFHHNLTTWISCHTSELLLGTLYNPGLPELAWDIGRNSILMNPNTLFGSQALVISHQLACYFIEHWFEGPPALDLKMGALAAQYPTSLYCHHPSLVQHLGKLSAWGAGFHQANDFNPGWRAAMPDKTIPVEFLPVSSGPQP